MMCLCGCIGKEDSVAGIDKGCRVVQGDLPASVVLAASVFSAESPMFEGVGMSIVLPCPRDEVMKHVRMWVGVHQQSQWCIGFTCNGYMNCSVELPDKGGLKDAWLIVKGEV